MCQSLQHVCSVNIPRIYVSQWGHSLKLTRHIYHVCFSVLFSFLFKSVTLKPITCTDKCWEVKNYSSKSRSISILNIHAVIFIMHHLLGCSYGLRSTTSILIYKIFLQNFVVPFYKIFFLVLLWKMSYILERREQLTSLVYLIVYLI
jgi:hypothetical protein